MSHRSPSLLSAILVALFHLCGCSSSDDPLPSELLGHWVSKDKRYEARFLELTSEGVLIVGQGAGRVDRGSIRSIVHSKNETGPTRYEITYLDQAELELVLVLLLADDKQSFKFDNSSAIRWQKQEQGQ